MTKEQKRELLEQAAKAVGILFRGYDEFYENFTALDKSIDVAYVWNPIDKDHDVFHLAVTLGVTIIPFERGVFVSRSQGEPVICMAWGNKSKAAVTRLAIVSFAAGVGKAMP